MMLNYIDSYEKGQIGINLLITNLEALLNFIKENEVAWKKLFQKQWAIIEDEYAFASVENNGLLKDDALREVKSALEQMKILLSEKIKKDDS